MKKPKLTLDMVLIMAILAGLFTWSLYNLLHTLSGDILMSFGIVNNYWQIGIILIVTGTLLIVIGKKKLRGLIVK